jgi:vacuolar protein sorting-associated protein VTA1
LFYDRKTAKTFLAASIFLELLKTFGEIDPEVNKNKKS